MGSVDSQTNFHIRRRNLFLCKIMGYITITAFCIFCLSGEYDVVTNGDFGSSFVCSPLNHVFDFQYNLKKKDIGGSIPKDCCLVVLTPRQTSLSEEETCSYARSWAISSPLLIGGFILSDETSCCHQWRCWLKLCILTPESCVRFPVYFEEKTDLREDIGGSIPRDNCHGQF